MPSQTLQRGNLVFDTVLQVSLAPVAVAANSTVEQSFTVPGLLSSDVVSEFSFQGPYTVNVGYTNARVAAANVLTVAYSNGTGAPVTPPSGQYFLNVARIENFPPPAVVN